MITINSLLPAKNNNLGLTHKIENHSSDSSNTTTETKGLLNVDHLKANFLSFSSLKKANNVSFGRSILSDFDLDDVAKMKTQIDKCKYVKDIDTLVDSKEFQVICKPESIILKNIRQATPTDEKAFLGVCDDLSRHMLNLLSKMNENKEFDNQYVFELVSGNDNSYFYEKWNHQYILCWPQSKDEKIRSQIEKTPTEFPKGVLLIDPSSNTIGFPGRDVAGYKLKGFAKEIKPDEVLTFDSNGYTTGTSLGTMEHLNPDHMETKAIVGIAFTKIEGQKEPKVNLYIQREPEDDCAFWINWKNEVKPDSPLMKIIERVRSDIKKQFEN